MTNLTLRALVEGYLGKPAVCTYKGRRRCGHICTVKQGPAVRDSADFLYLDAPDGAIYVDWLELGDASPKCFRWDRVIDFSLMNQTSGINTIEIKATLRPWRPRPTI